MEGADMPCVLLVDDNESLLRFTARNLTSAIGDLDVYTASSCASARKAARECRPDILIVDQKLPDGGGYSLLFKLRQQQPNLRAIMITAETPFVYGRSHDDDLSYHVLAKPFEADDLIALVERALGRQQAFAAAGRIPSKVHRFEKTFDRHLAQNLLSGLLACLRAFEMDLITEAESPERVRALVDSYIGQLVGSVAELSRTVSGEGIIERSIVP